MQKKTRFALLGMALAATAVMAVPTIASAGPGPKAQEAVSDESRCLAELDAAIRQDMESFANYDAQAWRDVHHEDAITIFASGTVIQGRDAVVAALRSHFEDREAIWEYTELKRLVQDCKTAFILFDTTYTIPSVNFVLHAKTGVTFVRDRGNWLVLTDQNTQTPA